MAVLSFLRRDPPVLTGKQVLLRAPDAGDYREWARLRQESRAFLEPWEPRWSSDEFERGAWRMRLRRYREDYAAGTGVTFFVLEKASGRLCGGISIAGIRRGVSQSGQVGYWMGQPFAGRGLMLDALQALIPFAFQSLRLHRIEAACIPENGRSVRVLEKAGFRREGLLRSYLKINDIWQDHVLYALIAHDRRGESAQG